MLNKRISISLLLIVLLLAACTQPATQDNETKQTPAAQDNQTKQTTAAQDSRIKLTPEPARPSDPNTMNNGTPKPWSDFRSRDLSEYDLTKDPDVLRTLEFDVFTRWPEPEKMGDFRPADVLTWGLSPGLGVETLHQQGITGKGVSVAYIDQPLLMTHEGLKGIDLVYTKIRLEPGKGDDASMHGPAVLSLLAEPGIGVAPGVKVYYYAHPSWLRDQTTHADALRAVIKQNRELPEGQKIRAVGFSDGVDPREQNQAAFDEAIREAEAEGILVVLVNHPVQLLPAAIRPYKDKNDRANWEAASWASGGGEGLWVPTGGRTHASGYPKANHSYAYSSSGGLSWGAPYVVGTLALGWQVDPSLTNEKAMRYLQESAKPFGPGPLIDPVGFVELVKKNK